MERDGRPKEVLRRIISIMRFRPPFVRHTGGMSRLHFRDSRVVPAALLVTVGMAMGACSGNSTSAPPSHSTTAAPTTSPATSPASSGEPMSGSGAVAAIESNWATFFNAKTPLARRLALLENGPQFTAVIKAQQGQGLAALATSKVSHVSLTGTDHASVTYTIYIAGHPQ